MPRITVIGGTGYAGSAIVREAAARGHQVTALSRSVPGAPVPGVTYVQGDATDEEALSSAIAGSAIVVDAIAPRGSRPGHARAVHRTVARLVDAAGARLFIVGGASSLRPAPGADRFVTDPATSACSPRSSTRRSATERGSSSRTSPPRPRHSTGCT